MELENIKVCELSSNKIELDENNQQNSLENTEYSENFQKIQEVSKPCEKEFLECFANQMEYNEILTDLEMSEKIAEFIESVDELRYERWSELSSSEKVAVLNKVEQYVAKIEHRPPLKVESELLKPRSLGYQSASEGKIALNSLYINSNQPDVHRKVIETIIHEGRHAYQHYNVDVRCIHESMYEVNQWRENFYNPKYGYYSYRGQKLEIPFGGDKHYNAAWRLYYYQPVEIDARKFSGDVITRLESKGFFGDKSK